jgi:hypothetical protein
LPIIQVKSGRNESQIRQSSAGISGTRIQLAAPRIAAEMQQTEGSFARIRGGGWAGSAAVST